MQDTPGDAAAAYLARLQTTEQVLSAVRRAHAAKARIQSGQGPVAHREQPLPELSSARLLRHQHQRPAICINLELSACGAWLAVGLAVEQPSGEGKTHDLKELAVYSVPDFQLRTVLVCGSSSSSIYWAPEASHLNVALWPFPWNQSPGAVPPSIPAACTVDAETGAVLSSLSATTIQAALALAARTGSENSTRHQYADRPVWSRCGTKVLIPHITRLTPGLDRHPLAGVLRVYDVVQDQQVLETQYVVDAWRGSPAVWHPSLKAVLLGLGVSVHDPAAFAQAQLALGQLPATMQPGIYNPGFLADGQLYCAWHHNRDPAIASHRIYDVLRTSMQDLSIAFTPFHRLPADGFKWAPSGCLAIVYQRAVCGGGSTASLRNLATHEELCCLDNLPERVVSLHFAGCPEISPSYNFVGDASMERLRISCVKTGVQLWSSAAFAPAPEQLGFGGWYNLFPWESQWLPSGCGLVCLARCLTMVGHSSAGPVCMHAFLFG